MNEEKIIDDLLSYLKGNVSIAKDLLPEGMPIDFPLLESGAIDSLELFKLIAHLEESFGIEIRPEEMVPGNFSTPRAIAKVVLEHLPQ